MNYYNVYSAETTKASIIHDPGLVGILCKPAEDESEYAIVLTGTQPPDVVLVGTLPELQHLVGKLMTAVRTLNTITQEVPS